MKRKGVIIRTLLIFALASLVFNSFTGKSYLQILLSPKYIFYLLGSISAITLLVLKKVTTPVRIVFLLLFFYIYGVTIGIHPSPLCAITKAALRYHLSGFIPPPMAVMAAVMLLLTVLGNKVFCGWICPLGCLQESVFLINSYPRKLRYSFFTSNAARSSLFGIFIIFLFLWTGNIYDFFNPFEIFHWHFTTHLIIIVSLVLTASLVSYRPFCQFVCPAGLITWIFEHMSLSAIRKDEKRCTRCGRCIQESPCNAIEGIIENRNVIPDCFACGACIKACPEEALSFSLR